jgi:hypothetical protein
MEPLPDDGDGLADPPPVPTGAAAFGDLDPFTELLAAIAEDRVRDAAAARWRTRWLVQQAEEEGTLAGVLADLAEQAQTVVCVTTAGRRHVGRLHALGADFVALRGELGATMFVALDALGHVRTQPGASAVTGDRPVRLERRLAEVLAELSADRPDIVVGTGVAEVRGELRTVGRDVVMLRLGGRPAAAAYVPLTATQEVRVG